MSEDVGADADVVYTDDQGNVDEYTKSVFRIDLVVMDPGIGNTEMVGPREKRSH